MKSKSEDKKTEEHQITRVQDNKSTFESLRFPVCIIGKRGELIYSNSEFRRLFNTDDDVVSLDWSHPFSPEYRRRIAIAYTSALKGQERHCFAVMRSSEGVKIPIEIYLFPLFDNNHVSSILVFLKVVEERMFSFDRNALSLYDGEENGGDSNIFEFSPFPIVRLDHAGEIIKASSSIGGLLGYGADEIKKKRSLLFKSVSRYDFSRLRKSIMSVWDGTVSFKRIGEVRISTKENEINWVNVILYPVVKENRVTAVELIIEDITKIKRLENRLSYMNRLQIIGDLAKGLFHSFNNIIHVILSRTQLLLQLTDRESVLEGLQIIERTAMESVKQIRRVQNFIREGERTEVTEEENIVEVIEDAIEFAKLQFKVDEKEKRRNITVERKYFALHNVKANCQVLREIFISMIFKVASSIRQKGIINVILRENNGLILSVGVDGSSSELLDSDDDAAGNILLSDVDIRRIAERMNIKIIEEESPNAYTMKAILPSKIVIKKKRDRSERVDYKMRNLDIMIVEDERELREILYELFDRLGNRVSVFGGREEALTDFRKDRCDVFITDDGLSGITGLELLARIKEIDEHVVTVLLTGWIVNEREVYRTVVDLFVQKPFKLEDLIRGISRLLKSKND